MNFTYTESSQIVSQSAHYKISNLQPVSGRAAMMQLSCSVFSCLLSPKNKFHVRRIVSNVSQSAHYKISNLQPVTGRAAMMQLSCSVFPCLLSSKNKFHVRSIVSNVSQSAHYKYW